MKTITIEDDLYTFIASQTKHIGESASDILRRLLMPEEGATAEQVPTDGAEETTLVAKEPAISEEPAAVKAEVEPPVIEQTTEVSEVAEQQVENVVNGANGDVFALIEGMDLANQSSRVEQFLTILSALHQTHAADFEKVLDVKGRNRLYFATDKEQLLQAGSSTNPKQVPASRYWVVTNNNTAKKVSMLTQVAGVLDYSEQDSKKLAALFAPELA